MELFRKPKYIIISPTSPSSINKDTKGTWIKCPSCKISTYSWDLEENYKVCQRCSYHFRLTAKERILYTFNKGSFKEWDKDIESFDFLNFSDKIPYSQRLKEAQEKSGMKEAILSGEAKIGNYKVATGILDFNFMGGSMGVVVGEKIARLFKRAKEEKLPVVIFVASGGARMQEGTAALFQMQYTAAAVADFKQSSYLPYISILTDPSTGGVLASFASLADIIIAEKGAFIGFSGPRVIYETTKEKLPNGFQKAEFLLQHGQLDLVLPRSQIVPTLIKLFSFLIK